METISRDLTGLSDVELTRVVQADAPELAALLSDFQDSLKEARERVEPLLAMARQRQLPEDGGVRFLQLKLQLLLSYLINLSFYLMLKAQGRAVRSHPVIDALLRHRLLLERLRPLEAKLSYRLQKLLQLAAADGAGGDTPGAGSGLTDAQRDLAERPNPDALLVKGGAARSAAALGADEDSAEDSVGDGEADSDGLYRPPKLAAVHYDDEPGGSKRRRQQERLLERASSSRMVRELREELSEAPRAIHADDFGRAVDADSAAVARYKKEEQARRAYEEANFQRLTMTKEEKRAHKKRAAAASGVAVDELGAFDDFSHLYDVATTQAADPREEKLRALRQYMNSLEQRGGQNAKKGRSADADAPVRTLEARAEKAAEREAKRAARAARQAEADEAAEEEAMERSGKRKRPRGNEEDVPEEDPFYAAIAKQSSERKAGKAAKKAAEVADAAAAFSTADQAAPDDARHVGRDIEKNRGLTRQRKKIDANPRVKNREKYRKAVIRRKGQVRNVQAPSNGPYGGEATGIKKNVSHSTRFA